MGWDWHDAKVEAAYQRSLWVNGNWEEIKNTPLRIVLNKQYKCYNCNETKHLFFETEWEETWCQDCASTTQVDF